MTSGDVIVPVPRGIPETMAVGVSWGRTVGEGPVLPECCHPGGGYDGGAITDLGGDRWDRDRRGAGRRRHLPDAGRREKGRFRRDARGPRSLADTGSGGNGGSGPSRRRDPGYERCLRSQGRCICVLQPHPGHMARQQGPRPAIRRLGRHDRPWEEPPEAVGVRTAPWPVPCGQTGRRPGDRSPILPPLRPADGGGDLPGYGRKRSSGRSSSSSRPPSCQRVCPSRRRSSRTPTPIPPSKTSATPSGSCSAWDRATSRGSRRSFASLQKPWGSLPIPCRNPAPWSPAGAETVRPEPGHVRRSSSRIAWDVEDDATFSMGWGYVQRKCRVHRTMCGGSERVPERFG